MLGTLLLVLSACASGTTETASATSESSTSAATATTPAATTPPEQVTTVNDPAAEPATDPESSVPESSVPESSVHCVTIADFESDAANEQWIVVNDGVMGGLSFGDRTFADGAMVFSGTINTDGGGFSSLRLPLSQGLIEDTDQVVIRARADARSYMVTFDDSLPNRNQRVSFRAPIEFVNPGEWETVTVQFADLFPAAFGTPVESEPFRNDLATRIGIMLGDGLDGEFKLEVDTIEVCASGAEVTDD